MSTLPPLRPLTSFRAAAKHESLSKAANELNLTHGAVSRAVKQLEEFFGFDLFHRRNRGIRLTGRGRLFAAHVDEALSELEKACEAIRAPDARRRLSVSCEPSLAMRWLMPHLDDFHQAHPHIDIHLSTEGGPIDLSAEGAHLAIRRSDFVWPGHYRAHSLGKERIGPVCSPAYWDKAKHDAQQLLHTRTRPEAWTDWKEISGQPCEAESERFFDHFYFSLQAAVAGLGLAIGPEPMVRGDLEQGLLIAPFGFMTTSAEYVVLSLEKLRDDEDMLAFASWLKQHLGLPTE